MTSNLPVEPNGNWLTEWLATGKIPGAAKAIAHLIGSGANAGAAWINIATAKGQQHQQAIEDETRARSVFYKALSKAAAESGSKDPEMIERAINRLAGKGLREQINREEIAKKTAKIVDEDSAVGSDAAPPEDDWLNYFSSHAEQASSERLQDTWARVLAGEIRKPGSFSFRTLQFVSLLDQNTAKIIEEVADEVFDGVMIPFAQRFGYTPFFGQIAYLRECGILTDDLVQRVPLEEGRILRLKMSEEFIIDSVAKVGGNWDLDHAPLTEVGKEIYKILHPRPRIESAKAVAKQLLDSGRFSPVHLYGAERSAGAVVRYVQIDRLES